MRRPKDLAPRDKSAGWSLAALALVPALLLLDTTAALAAGWSSPSQLPRAVLVASGAALGIVILTAAVPPWRERAARWAPRLALLTLSSLLGLVVVEAALRPMPGLLGQETFHTRGPNLERVFRPDPVLFPGVSGASRYHTGSLGTRGPELPPGDSVDLLLAVGASSTECTYLDDSETWPAVLAARLNAAAGAERFWVGNLGISGYSTIEHLEWSERSPLARRADGLIYLIGVNDFLKALNGSLELGSRPLWRRSLLIDHLLALRRRRMLRESFILQEDERGHSLVPRRAARRAGLGRAALPDLTRAVRGFQDRVERLAALCRSRGQRCLFLAQPTVWRADLSPAATATLWLGVDHHGTFAPPEQLARGLDLFQQGLLATCRDRGLECLALEELEGREDLYYDDAHWNEAGARALAERIAAHWLGEEP